MTTYRNDFFTFPGFEEKQAKAKVGQKVTYIPDDCPVFIVEVKASKDLYKIKFTNGRELWTMGDQIKV